MCDASYNWFKKLAEGLEAEKFVPSKVDQYVFIRDDCIVLVYVDDVIAVSRESKVLDQVVSNLQKKEFVLTDDGTLNKYLGVDVKYKKNGSFELIQPFLIERFFKLIGLDGDSTVNTRDTPAVKPILHKDLKGLPRKHTWNHRQAIGMLTYLQGTTRPDISIAVHQCAHFCINPMLSHERAVLRIGKYLLGTKDKGVIFRPDKDRGLEYYVDADFAGGWAKSDPKDADNVLSRTGYVIFYADCPLLWASRMQTEIALSTVESEYIALSEVIRDALMNLIEEVNTIFSLNGCKPKIHCKVFEDNESCIAMAKKKSVHPEHSISQ